MDEEVNADYAGNPLTGVPKHTLNTGFQAKFGNGLYTNLTHQFVDEIPLTDANSLNSEAFNIINLKIGYKTQINPNLLLGLDFGINNIADTKYAQSVLINASSFGGSAPRYFYPGNDRNYYGSLKLSYIL